jgi:hypothetical protein
VVIVGHEPVPAGILMARRVPMTTRIGERRAPLDRADQVERIPTAGSAPFGLEGEGGMVDSATPERPADFHRVVWPRARRMVAQRALAPRLRALDRKTIAFLWDSVFRGDEIFPVLEDALGRRFPGAKFVAWDVFGSIFGGEEARTLAELPDRLRRLGVDAVVSAVGC